MTKQEKGEHAESKEALVPSLVRFPRLARRFDELLEDFFRGPLWPAFRWPEENLVVATPAIDVYEEDGTVVVKAEMPGMKREDLTVEIAGDVLTISGKRVREEKVDRKDYHRLERSEGAFRRSVHLPAEVQLEQVTAQMKDGVLEIRAPKTEEAKARARTIEVK